MNFENAFIFYWFNIEIENIYPIKFKNERSKIKKVEFNEVFWNTFNKSLPYD